MFEVLKWYEMRCKVEMTITPQCSLQVMQGAHGMRQAAALACGACLQQQDTGDRVWHVQCAGKRPLQAQERLQKLIAAVCACTQSPTLMHVGASAVEYQTGLIPM